MNIFTPNNIPLGAFQPYQSLVRLASFQEKPYLKPLSLQEYPFPCKSSFTEYNMKEYKTVETIESGIEIDIQNNEYDMKRQLQEIDTKIKDVEREYSNHIFKRKDNDLKGQQVLRELQEEIAKLKKQYTKFQVQLVNCMKKERESYILTKNFLARIEDVHKNTRHELGETLLYNPVKKRMIKQETSFPFFTILKNQVYQYIKNIEDIYLDFTIDYKTGKEYLLYIRGNKLVKQTIGEEEEIYDVEKIPSSMVCSRTIEDIWKEREQFDKEMYEKHKDCCKKKAQEISKGNCIKKDDLCYTSTRRDYMLKCIICENKMVWLSIKDKIRLYDATFRTYEEKEYKVIKKNVLLSEERMVSNRFKRRSIRMNVQKVEMDKNYNLYYEIDGKEYVDYFMIENKMCFLVKVIRDLIMDYI